MLSLRGLFTGAAIIVATSLVLLVTSASGTACPDNAVQLGNRVDRLEDTYTSAAGADTKTIAACTSLDCARAAKLDMARELDSFNDGLERICWPGRDQPKVDALAAANDSLAQAYLRWAEATGPIDDQTLEAVVHVNEIGQAAAVRSLSSTLH